MSEFDLPPKRQLPFDVRASMRAKLNEELNRPRRRSRKSLGALFATFALLTGTAVGGPLLLGAGDEGLQDGGMPNFDAGQHDRSVKELTARKDVDLERCRQAARASGRTGTFPDPARWRAVFRFSSMSTGAITAVLAGDRPVFCEASRTQVNLWAADSAADSTDHQIKIHAVSSSGFLLGSTSRDSVAIDTRVDSYEVRGGVPNISYANQRTTVIEGLFVVVPPKESGAMTITAGGVRQHRVTKLGTRRQPPSPAILVTDQGRTTDRSSSLGVELGACITRASALGSRPVADAENWEPALRLDLGTRGTAVVARLDNQLGVCKTVGGASSFGAVFTDGSQRFERPVSAEEPVVPGSLLVDGLLITRFSGRVAPEVRSMTLLGPEGQELRTLIGNGVFVALPVQPMTLSEEAEAKRPLPNESWRARIVERGPNGTDRTRVVPAFKY
ncbi:hypothetical protein GCM10022247_27800 [Allokutzneria multivorans]|uniref:F5/8 type C domain-containing protein n=1 Tax=Allokutzneria multivorans TaxID=1142134 RepID=A0ABP7S209_9PSEU